MTTIEFAQKNKRKAEIIYKRAKQNTRTPSGTVEQLREDCLHWDRIIEACKLIYENPYWANACLIAEKQRAKGIEEYGHGIEESTLSPAERVEYCEEELVDALMYLEHIKAGM